MISRTHLVWVVALLGVGLAVSAGFYPSLPNPAPTHWNIHGEVDGWGPSWVSAFLMPLVSVGIAGLMIGLPLLGPMRKNFESFKSTYGRICILIVAAFVALQIVILLKTAGFAFPIGAALAIVIGLMLAVLGNWMGKVRRNFYVGIRTPWTLANDAVWEKTHRLGGRVFAAVGLATAISGLFGSNIASFIVMMGGLLVAVLWSVVYSYRCYVRLGRIDDPMPS